jgi:hypothetical protein
MVALSEGIIAALVDEYGRRGFLRRISDPFWFQSLACVLGYDWHSSGTTTVTTAALRDALERRDVGVRLAGGKGRSSRKTPEETAAKGSAIGLSTHTIERLQRTSRLVAKVDTAALQDGYDLYHHALLFTEDGDWAVVQQGMNDASGFARRYHWLGEDLGSFVDEPHAAILGTPEVSVLDMTSPASREARSLSLDLARDQPNRLRSLFVAVTKEGQASLDRWSGREETFFRLPTEVRWETLRAAYEVQPAGYEDLLLVRGMGRAAVRALALVADLVYGTPSSWRDPVKYSFAVGGKDGVPFPVDCDAMDACIDVLRGGVQASRAEVAEKRSALLRLGALAPRAV